MTVCVRVCLRLCVCMCVCTVLNQRLHMVTGDPWAVPTIAVDTG